MTGAHPLVTTRSENFRRCEDAYVEARKLGERASAAAARLGLTATGAVLFERAYRYQTTSANTLDNSCPKFANEDVHLAAFGGRGFPVMPTLAELRRPT